MSDCPQDFSRLLGHGHRENVRQADQVSTIHAERKIREGLCSFSQIGVLGNHHVEGKLDGITSLLKQTNENPKP